LTSKKTKQAFTTSIFGSIINLSINIIFIPIIGIQAASISTFLAFFFMWLVRIYQTRKFYKIKIDLMKLVLSLSVLFIQTFFIIRTENYNFIYQLILYMILILIFIKEENIIIKKILYKLKK
jgi:O-antigen/teichoic acid export membrane protein